METSSKDASTHTIANVVFLDVPCSYPPSRDVSCRYTIPPDFMPTSRDWIGLFKVGWINKSDYYTFVWTDMSVERSDEAVSREAVFKGFHLPQDQENSYQFCYLDSSGHMCGASMPFSFRTPDESTPDSSIEDDVLVVYTKEQIKETLRERDELKAQRDQARDENETLSTSVRRLEDDITSLQEQLLQKDAEIVDVERKLELLQAENNKLIHSAEGFDEESQRLKRKLKEIQEIIVVKNELIQDKDDMILFLQRQNKELISQSEVLHEAHDEFPVAPAIPPELLDNKEDSASYNKDLPLQETQATDDADNTVGVTAITEDTEEDEEVLECRYCQEKFPGITQQQLEQHENSHSVCPFCLQLCDHVDQGAFEDHVYSHNEQLRSFI